MYQSVSQGVYVTVAVTLVLLGLSFGYFFNQLDQRLVLTYSERFSDYKQIREVFRGKANYSVQYNPRGVRHVVFAKTPETLEDLQDLQRRGLIGAFNFSASAGPDPNMLHELMVLSWCSSYPPIPDVLPALRTPGCKCISNAYAAFVQETQPANATNATVVQVAPEVRQRYGDQVYRCWDQRPVVRSRTCGRMCTTHALGLTLFANIVMLLVGLAYILSYQLQGVHPMVIKLALVAVGALLCTPYFYRDLDANSLNVGGVAVCLFYLLITLDEELSIRDGKKYVGPNPFITCLLTNLPLILSAHTIQLGVAGYARDIWAVASFGLCGGLLGLMLQRYFWMSWNLGSNDALARCGRSALVVAYVCLQGLLLLLFVAYYFDRSEYFAGSYYTLVVYECYLTVLPWLLSRDLATREPNSTWETLTFMQGAVLFATLLANTGMTIVGAVDGNRN